VASGGGTWHISNNTRATADAKLMYGYLAPSYTSGTATVSLSGIPYATYNVYVYFGSDNTGQQGKITIGTTNYFYTVAGNVNFSGFTQTTDTTGSINLSANYARFSGLTGSTASITSSTTGGSGQDSGAGIFGVQIVEAGEVPQTPTITGWSLSNQVMRLTFIGGELQSAPTVNGVWAGTGNSSSQYSEVIGGGATNKFFRVSSQLSPAQASNPSPANSAANVSISASLS
jgi:hypothetical protein